MNKHSAGVKRRGEVLRGPCRVNQPLHVVPMPEALSAPLAWVLC